MASDPHPHHSADCDTKERLQEELAGTNNTAPERRAQSTNHADDGVCKTATHASKTKVKRKLKLEERKKRRKTIRDNQVYQIHTPFLPLSQLRCTLCNHALPYINVLVSKQCVPPGGMQ